MITVHTLVNTVVLIIVLGVLFWLLKYLIDTIPMFGPYKQVANVVLLVLAVLTLVCILLNLIGYGVVVW